MGRKREYLGGLIEVQGGYACGAHLRLWRTRIGLARLRGVGFGVQVAADPWPTVWLGLLLWEVEVQLWSHRDDCECDRCLPF